MVGPVRPGPPSTLDGCGAQTGRDFFGVVTRDRMRTAAHDERRLFLRTFVGCLPAPRAEAATAWWLHRARNVALQNDPGAHALATRVRDRDGREQRLRVRVLRMLVHIIRFAELDDLAEVHHGD